MFITAIIIGVIALIGSIIMFLEGIIVMLSKNKIRQGFYYLAVQGCCCSSRRSWECWCCMLYQRRNLL